MSDIALSWRQRLGLFIAGTRLPSPKRVATAARMYANARPSRFNVGLGSAGNSSADAELGSSLTQLRAASRQMVRDAPYAKRAKVIIVNNVIGPGIGMQAQVKTTRGELNKRVNADIEAAYTEWSCAANCHTGGALHFNDLERMAMGQVFETGEVFIRAHLRKFGDSAVPLALEVIEPERLPDTVTPGPALAGANIRQCVELDPFGRAVAYWVRSRHPGDVRYPGEGAMTDTFERVDAAEMFHLRIVDRWPQTRGEPWMHTAIRKLDSMEQYSTSELRAAQADATQFGTVTTTAVDGGPLATNPVEQTDGDKPEIQIQDGVIVDLEPGETLDYHTPTRPNTALDPFLRYMLREVAAGIGVSYESLSRDYSQTTFSSGRLAILDDRDTWRVLQQWWLRSFRTRLHKLWLQQAAYAGAIPSVPVEQYMPAPARFEAVKFKPRGWSWIDPTKEVAAYKEAEMAGYISAEDIIAQTANGFDIEDVVDAIKRSNELYEAAGIVRDTDVAATNAATAAGKTASAPASDDPPDEPDAPEHKPNDPPKRVVSLAR